METLLPCKLNIISTRIPCHSLFISPNNHSQRGPDCRDAPRSIRRFKYVNNCMNMIWHNDEYRNPDILIMNRQFFQTFFRINAYFAKYHVIISYFSKEMFFSISANCYKIITTGIIMKHRPYIFMFR